MLAIGSVSIGTFMGKGDTIKSASALFTQIIVVAVTLNIMLAVLASLQSLFYSGFSHSVRCRTVD